MGSQPKAIWSVLLATFTYFFAVTVIAPIISPYAINLGATPAVLGLLSALTSATAIIMRPIFGFISDRGHRFEMMMLGCILSCIASLIYAASNNLLLFAVARIIQGLASASFLPSSISTAMDLAPLNRIGEILGWRSTMFGVSQLLGPGLGGYLSDILDYRATFISSFALTLVSILILSLAARWAKGMLKSNDKLFGSKVRNVKKLLTLNFTGAMIAVALYATSYSALNTFLPAIYNEIGFGASIYGIYASVQGGSSIIARATSGKIADRKGPIHIASSGLALITLAYVLLTSNYLPPTAYLCATIFGVGLGLTVPAIQLLALGGLPSEMRGLGSGIYSIAFELGFLIGPILFGLLIEYSGGYTSILWLLPIFPAASLITVQLVGLANRFASR